MVDNLLKQQIPELSAVNFLSWFKSTGINIFMSFLNVAFSSFQQKYYLDGGEVIHFTNHLCILHSTLLDYKDGEDSLSWNFIASKYCGYAWNAYHSSESEQQCNKK